MSRMWALGFERDSESDDAVSDSKRDDHDGVTHNLRQRNVFVVGIAGKLGSGKTTVCNALCDDAPSINVAALNEPPPPNALGRVKSVVVRNFSDALKEQVRDEFGIPMVVLSSREGKNSQTTAMRKANGAPMSVGELLQRVGQQRRDECGPDVWIDALKAWLMQQRDCIVVIGDVRYVNEAKFVRDVCNGLIVRLEGDPAATRATSTRDPTHPSETGLDEHRDMFTLVVDTDRASIDETTQCVWQHVCDRVACSV